jgi:DNA-binding PucR family transcriptional regulator
VPLPDQAAQLELVSRVLFEFADAFATATSDSYAIENRRWLSSADAARTETVRAILAGEVSTDSASRRLAYELSNLFHVGLVLHRSTAPNGETTRLDEAAAAILRNAGADARLVIPVDRTEVRAWAGFRTRQRATRFSAPTESDVVVAVGSAHQGVAGFRSTYQEALAAARLAALDPSPAHGGRVVRYDDVRLLTLLTADAAHAAGFMRDELGELAGGGEPNRALRETVRVYLECNCSPQEAAKRLQVARNTVVYRIRRAEQILGHDVKHAQLELSAALRLADCFGLEHE